MAISDKVHQSALRRFMHVGPHQKYKRGKVVMKKVSEKRYINKVNLAKNCNIFGIFCRSTKRHFRADGLSLLPSALRPRLVGTIVIMMLITITSITSGCIISNKHTFADGTGEMTTPSGTQAKNEGTSSSTNSSLTLTIPSNPLSLDLNPSTNNGFASISGTFNIKTDNDSGYTVSIKSKNESGDSLVNGNNKLTSITEATTEDNFKSDSKFINTWGWLPSKLNSENNTNYQIAPGTEEVILESTEEANNETGNNYNISLAAKVSETMPTGTYSNTFVITSIANKPKLKSMQEFTADDCAALTQHDGSNGDSIYTTLVDSRDGNEYKVAKLKDGRCWMVENLKIAGKDISSADSDVSDSFIIPPSDISKFNVGTYGYNQVNNSATYIDNSYGGYYTWYTATAGTGDSSITTDGINANESICPKGWRLPTSGSNGEFNALAKAYGGTDASASANLRNTPVPGFVLSGVIDANNGSPINQSASGPLWSSTSYDSISAYNFGLSSSMVYPDTRYNRVTGFSVRCLVREPKKITDLQYLQDWAELSAEEKTQVINSMQDETNYTLTDKRDNTQYTVAKLKDGKIWMTQNLKIAGKNISSSDSDMTSSSFSIPAATAAFTFKTDITNVNNSKAYVDSYGGLYTWYTATAGTGNSSITTGDVNASGSICPKGWRLPTGGSSSEFNDLVTAYGGNNSTGSAALRATPVPGFTYAGCVTYLNGSLSYQGRSGDHWSSTSDSSTRVYTLLLESSSADPAYFNYRVSGRSVRCVARERTITYDNIMPNNCTAKDIPAPQNIPLSQTTVTLSDKTPTGDYYNFKGWCTVQPNGTSCSGQTYKPGQQMPLSNDGDITLYGIWGKPLYWRQLRN